MDMANWGVVIGIDRYARPQDRLQGAVRDADAMCQWLLDPAGGAVPPQNLAVLLELDNHQPTAPVRFGPAKRADIVLAIEDLLARSNNGGDRLFFYFAGHGISGRLNASFPTTILAADFQPLLPDNGFTLISLYELFQCTRFKEQFFFIDACRNAAFDRPKRLGEYPNPRTPVPPVSPQFVMYATQPGVAAIEVVVPGDERGAFTGALLAGLKGKGAAKRWDPDAGDYVVRWSSLFDHVRDTIIALKLNAGTGPRPLIQEPSKFGEDGGQDPELGRFSVQAFAAEPLKIDVTPNNLSAIASARYGEMGPGATDCPAPLPVTVSLAPREYWVDALAPGFRTKGRARIVKLYAQSDVVIELEPTPPPAPPLAARAPAAPVPPAAPGPMESAKAAPRDALVVRCQDQLVQIEIASQSGQLLATGRDRVVIDAEPGFYRARLVSPEGVVVEELIPIRAGDGSVEQTLRSPTADSPGMQWAVARGGFNIGSDGSLMPSESIGVAENLKLSTLLALAAGARIEDDRGPGSKLRQIPLPGFHDLAPGANCGIQVVLGDERMQPGLWPNATVGCWPIDSAPFAVWQTPLSGAEVRSAALTPNRGPYWLKIDLDLQSSIVLPVLVSSDRLTLLVITRESDLSVEMHQYQLPSLPGPPADYRARDPFFSGSQFAALRRIELMQRATAHGRVSPLLPDIELLLQDKWLDPLAGCLGGFLLLRMGRAADLDVATYNLTTFFGDIPDTWVLRGEFLRFVGRVDEAKDAYRRALDAGIPLYRDGLELLNTAIGAYALAYPRNDVVREAFAVIPRGSLWAAGGAALANINMVRGDAYAVETFSSEPGPLIL
jgi:hypothetical protein